MNPELIQGIKSAKRQKHQRLKAQERERQIKKPTIQAVDVIPLVSFALPKQVAKPTSKKPAIISSIQFIVFNS